MRSSTSKKRGQRLYAGDAREQAEQEVERFLKRYSSGAQIHTVDAPLSGDYTVPRLFARCAEEMLKQSPIQPGNYQKGFYLPSTYPPL